MASFSCSISAWFVLSHNMPMINTMSNWLRSGAFRSPPSPFLRLHWPLATDHWPLSSTPRASRLTKRHLPDQRGEVARRPLPRWLLPDTDRQIAKDRTRPDLDERPLYTQYVTEPGDSCGQIYPFFPTRRRSTLDHSLVAGGAAWFKVATLAGGNSWVAGVELAIASEPPARRPRIWGRRPQPP
jgi:hypothetical protein